MYNVYNSLKINIYLSVQGCILFRIPPSPEVGNLFKVEKEDRKRMEKKGLKKEEK